MYTRGTAPLHDLQLIKRNRDQEAGPLPGILGQQTALVLGLMGALIALIALVDWRVRPNVSLGFLYIIPVVAGAAWLSRLEILAVAGLCSMLRDVFGPFRGQPGTAIRLMLVFVAFAGAGLLFSEMAGNRRLLVRHLWLQREAEGQMQALAETSPLAFLTVDSGGKVLVANESAHRLGLCARRRSAMPEGETGR